MPVTGSPTPPPTPKRADAQRNARTLLAAAAEVFVTAGVEAPVRDIAARAGVGMGTIYRHFPTRADLIIGVYRHQVDACAEAGPALLAGSESPFGALARWIELFVDFLVTKHGLAAAMRSDHAGFEVLHAYFLDRLVPVCAELLLAAVRAEEIRADVDALELMRGVGNLCVGADGDSRYDARRMVGLLIAGLGQARPSYPLAMLRLDTVLEPRGPAGAIVLTDDQVADLGGGRTAPVRVTIGDVTAGARVARMGGENLIGFSKKLRAELGVEIGQRVDVVIALDTEPRTVQVPAALAEAFRGDAEAAAAFAKLALTHQREYARWIDGAKREETRRSRVEKSLQMLRAGRTR